MNTPTPKTNWDKLNPEIAHHGRSITLPSDPANMPLRAAIVALERREKDELQKFKVYELFDAYPTDAAVAMTKAMIKLYGWASPQTEHKWHGDEPPTMLSVKTGHGVDDVVQVPLGQFMLPGVDAPINTMIHPNAGFVIYGEIKKRDRHVILELATETRKILKEESIYRGKAIRLAVDDDGDLITGTPPEYMNVSDTTEADLIFDGDVQDQINTNLLVPLKETKQCRIHKIPLKRGVLLEGPFGTGKSLLARLTAATAERNGWTFVLLDKVQGLRPALEFAVKYAPAVVFAEDIDRIIEERDDAANDLINTIDGVVSKTSEVMIVLTTNHVNKINPVILRPGRLDAVISLRPPTRDAAERLIRHYAMGLLKSGAPLAEASIAVEGMIPASIREVVERAKLGMIGRQATTLDDKDITVAAKSMRHHMSLLNPKTPELSIGDRLASALRQATNGHDDVLNEVNTKVKEIHNRVI